MMRQQLTAQGAPQDCFDKWEAFVDAVVTFKEKQPK
jgi:hypothetical protein